jgi:4-amino-4-deoxy-L-arabinose transferase-like glycosyltransferase
VLVIGLMPWTALAVRALWDGFQISIAEWKVRSQPQRYLGHIRPGDAFPEFLVLWALFPIVFFSFSGSKLPGYILPSIPPIAILTGDYLFRTRRSGMPGWLLNMHAAMTGVLTFVLVLCPQYMRYQRVIPSPAWLAGAALLGSLAAALVIFVVRRRGVIQIRTITLVPLIGLLFFLLAINGNLLDRNYSARPLAREIASAAPQATIVATLDVRRDMVYGLAFYRNQDVLNYATDGVPAGAHVLVIPTRETPQLQQWLQGRLYQQLLLYPTQGLSVYQVYPRS